MPSPLRFPIPRLWPLVLVAAGCAAAVHGARAACQPPVAPGVVFAADGAGNFHAASNSLRHAVQDEGVSLHVETVDWSHGFCRIVADQLDYGHARQVGERLAREIVSLRSSRPGTRIYLLGHSAGAAVVLAAAETLPQGSVERIILLAPAVSACYDLRPALRCAHEGIDVFTSDRDWWYLGFWTGVLKTIDGQSRVAGGRTGFRPVVETQEDGDLYSKLREHPWQPCLGWSGNHGGHYGPYQQKYLRTFVLPLFGCPDIPWQRHLTN